MKTKSLSIIVGALLFAISNAVFATGACTACKIKNLGAGPYYDSLCTSSCIFIAIEQPIVGKPDCSSNSYWNYALDISTTSGRATYALLVTALATGQLINISGSGGCSLGSSGLVENFSWVNYAW
jgi:hypothetical protein